MKFNRKVVVSLFGSAALFAAVCSNFSILKSTYAAEELETGSRAERVMDNERLDRELRLSDESHVNRIASRLNVKSDDLLENFGRRGSMTEESLSAWRDIFGALSVDGRRNVTRADFENADVLAKLAGSYIRASQEGSNFHISPSDLLSMHRTWKNNQKQHFAQVLDATAEIARSNPSLSLDQAFDQALGKLGYLDKYRRGCRVAR